MTLYRIRVNFTEFEEISPVLKRTRKCTQNRFKRLKTQIMKDY